MSIIIVPLPLPPPEEPPPIEEFFLAIAYKVISEDKVIESPAL